MDDLNTDELSIPNELKEFFLEGQSVNTPFTEAIQFIFSNLIREYFSWKPLRNIGNASENESRPKQFNKTADNYNPLCFKILDYGRKPLDYFKGNFLKSLCFPDKTEKNYGRKKEFLVLTYNYLNHDLKEKTGKDGSYWIGKWKEKEANNDKGISTRKPPFSIDGAKTISNEFFDTIGKKNITSTEFYLAKDHDETQWFGILKEWDYPRRQNEQIKDQVISSFNDKYSFLTLVLGTGGCGKSTVLRRLCKDLADGDIYIIWVYDLGKVFENFEKFKPKGKYLLFIEDWQSIKSDKKINRLFLAKVFLNENIKLIIGDRKLYRKEYYQYINDSYVHKVTTEENREIIRKVLSISKELRSTADTILTGSRLNRSPIYLILFVIIRSYADKDILLGGKTRSFLSKFRTIVFKDLDELNKLDHLLAQILVAWAYVYKHKKVNILWESLLSLKATEETVSKQLYNFDIENPICRILSYYISVERFNFQILGQKKIFFFHHDLLVEQGLALPILLKFPKYNPEIVVSFLYDLYSRGDTNSVTSIYDSLDDAEIKLLNLDTVPLQVFINAPADEVFSFSKWLKQINKELRYFTFEDEWEFIMIRILLKKYVSTGDEFPFEKIIRLWVSRGYKSKCLIDTNLNIENTDYLYKELLKELIYKNKVKYPKSAFIKGAYLEFMAKRQLDIYLQSATKIN